jgi:hypothetical protein
MISRVRGRRDRHPPALHQDGVAWKDGGSGKKPFAALGAPLPKTLILKGLTFIVMDGQKVFAAQDRRGHALSAYRETTTNASQHCAQAARGIPAHLRFFSAMY